MKTDIVIERDKAAQRQSAGCKQKGQATMCHMTNPGAQLLMRFQAGVGMEVALPRDQQDKGRRCNQCQAADAKE